MKIRQKFLLTAISVSVLFVAFTATTIWNIKSIENDFMALKNNAFAGKVALLEINRDVNYVSRLTRNIMLGSDYQKDMEKLDSKIAAITKAYSQLEKSAVSPDEDLLIDQAKQATMAFIQDGKRHVQSLKNVKKNERYQSYGEYHKSATPLAVQSRKIFPKVIELKDGQTEVGLAELEQNIDSQLSMIYVAVPSLLLLLGGVFVFLNRSISTPLDRLTLMADEIRKGNLDTRLELNSKDEIKMLADAMNQMAATLTQRAELADAVADGDLTDDITPLSDKDRLGFAYQKMFMSLNDSLNKVHLVSSEIDKKSVQISDASQLLSQGATESAASLEEITSSLDELSGRTKLNAQNANQVNALSGEAKSVAEAGNEKMQQMVSAMEDINEAGQNINKIIKVIDEIAFQTNLLALNAAVEAARAGQHGKGFAVVAEEVRNLAARSAKAASETEELIAGSVEKTQNGAKIANETELALQEIFSSVSKVSDIAGEIATASNEQAEGISQISEGLGQIDKAVQMNTATAEESSSAAQELSQQASELVHMLSQYRLKNQIAAVSPRANNVSNHSSISWAGL